MRFVHLLLRLLQGTSLAVATYRGRVHIWDVAANRCLRRLEGHVARVGALAWNGDLLASGSRDRQILLRDIRATPTSGGGTTFIPSSAATPSASSSGASTNTLMSIDRELLSTSARVSLYGSPAASTTTPVSSPLLLPTFSGTIPSDLDNTCPGSVRVLKDHRQEVGPFPPLNSLILLSRLYL